MLLYTVNIKLQLHKYLIHRKTEGQIFITARAIHPSLSNPETFLSFSVIKKSTDKFDLKAKNAFYINFQ